MLFRSVRIVEMQTTVAPAWVRRARVLQRVAHFGLVPIGNGVTDVIDGGRRRRRRIGAGIVHDEEVAAFARFRTEGEIGAALALVVVDLHAHDVFVEVAGLRVIGAGIGNVIDADTGEAARGRRIGLRAARRVDRGRDADGLAEFAAADFAALELADEFFYETFYAVTLPG